MYQDRQVGRPADAFEFTGNWREYLPIAASNLLLTIVTLGIYRFWAKARERRYLWSRTRFIDDRLEWTGTGGEMFVGFVVAMLLFGLPLLILNFGLQAMILRGQTLAAGVAFVGIYLFLLWLAGLARFRALRYRLSRSWWHGIRGGAEDGGFGYAVSATWKPAVGLLALGLLIPWSMVSLWNERWNAMSFGRDRFESRAEVRGLMGRWVLLLLSPFAAMLLVGMLALALGFGGAFGDFTRDTEAALGRALLLGVVMVFAVYFLIGLIGIGYFAAYFRRVIGGVALGQLRFSFEARSKDWLKLFLGDVALLVLTLGLGIVFLGYRHWSFFVRHLGASGEIDVGLLAQSTARGPREAEGLADAFDIGAI